MRLIVEEVAAGAAGGGSAVDFEIDVLGDGGFGGVRAFFGEADAVLGFDARGFIDGFELFFVEHLFVDQDLFPALDRIVIALEAFDFVFGTVDLVFGVCDGVSVVAVGRDFEDGWAAFFVSALNSDLGSGADFVDVFSVELFPFDGEPRSAFGEAGWVGAGAAEAGAHGVPVILDDVDDGKVPERGEVEAFVEATLVDSTVAHETHGCSGEAFVFEAVGETETERCLTSNDAVTAPVVFVRSEEVHGPPLPFRAAGGFPEQLGHAFIHVHADGEGVAVIAVSGDDMIVGPHEGAGADGDAFLSDIEMEEASHLACLIVF